MVISLRIPRPMAVARGRSIPATAALGAPISFAIGKRQYISILNGPTQGTAGSLGAMSARFGWDSRAHPRRLLTFVLDGAGALPPTPGPTIRDARGWRRSRRRRGAGERGRAVVLEMSVVPRRRRDRRWRRARICGLRCRRWWRLSFAGVVRGGNEARGMPKFEELSDRELDALRHYIRARARSVTRPDGVAPPAPEAPAPLRRPSQRRNPHPNRHRVRWNRPVLRRRLNEREAGLKLVFHNVLATLEP